MGESSILLCAPTRKYQSFYAKNPPGIAGSWSEPLSVRPLTSAAVGCGGRPHADREWCWWESFLISVGSKKASYIYIYIYIRLYSYIPMGPEPGRRPGRGPGRRPRRRAEMGRGSGRGRSRGGHSYPLIPHGRSMAPPTHESHWEEHSSPLPTLGGA